MEENQDKEKRKWLPFASDDRRRKLARALQGCLSSYDPRRSLELFEGDLDAVGKVIASLPPGAPSKMRRPARIRRRDDYWKALAESHGESHASECKRVWRLWSSGKADLDFCVELAQQLLREGEPFHINKPVKAAIEKIIAWDMYEAVEQDRDEFVRNMRGKVSRNLEEKNLDPLFNELVFKARPGMRSSKICCYDDLGRLARNGPALHILGCAPDSERRNEPRIGIMKRYRKSGHPDQTAAFLTAIGENAEEFMEATLPSLARRYSEKICTEDLSFPADECLSLIRRNPRYQRIVESHDAIIDAISKRIPENPVDAYPLARDMHRKFVLHVGPTNSGKTHDAISALAAAGSGAYLGPLRLLAYEQYERLNSMGTPCSLLTGEEQIDVAGARHTSSTVEMADFRREYDCVVIDEAQMVSDPDRGGRWSEAIIGLAAREVHVCMAPEALPLAEKLVGLCGDESETVFHERKVPLLSDEREFRFPEDVRRGDALVVFSRRAVHLVAAQLAEQGISASRIYGSLPYDVRHREAERFATGASDVVVTTDAIGMGMNLPIARVVFVEQAKFDGHRTRLLTSSEAKQIAGRAGRYGVYDEGRFTSTFELDRIRHLIRSDDDDIATAPLGFPRSLLEVPGTASSIMRGWAELDVVEPFAKLELNGEIARARMLERLCDDAVDIEAKRLVLQFALMPFKDSSDELLKTWKEMFKHAAAGTSYPVQIETTPPGGDLTVLEEECAFLDLAFQYCRFEGLDGTLGEIGERRSELSAKINAILEENDVFDAKRCRECGKPLPWNYPHAMCGECHGKQRGSGKHRNGRRN